MWKNVAILAALLLAALLWWRAEHREKSADELLPTVSNPAVGPATAEFSNPTNRDSEKPASRRGASESSPANAATSDFGSLRVQLRWSDGSVAHGIALNFRRDLGERHASQRGIFRATSDEDGLARCGELLPGPVFVSTGCGDFKTAVVFAGKEREVVINIAAGLAVEGQVLDSRGVPVAQAEIHLTSKATDWLGMSVVARSDARGRFKLRDMPVGQALGATAAGHAPSALVALERKDVHANLLDDLRHMLRLEHCNQIEVVLHVDDHGGALQGQVSDARGIAVRGANVSLLMATHEPVPSEGTWPNWAPRLAQTDASGRFRFEGLPAEPSPVSVWLPSAPQWTGSVELQADATVELQVVLQEAASLTGVVRDASGAPVRGASVRAFQARFSAHFVGVGFFADRSVFGAPLAITDAKGRYQLAGVWPGEVHVYASPPRPELSRVREFHAEAVFHPAPGERLEWNPTLEAGRTIRGRARYADGAIMREAWVSAVENGSHQPIGGRVDDDGRFEFFNLGPGPFRLEVGNPARPPDSAPLFKTDVFPDGGEIDLVADYPSPEKNPSARVHGRFEDPLGRFHEPPEAILETSAGVRHFSECGKGAQFEFSNLAEGRYRLFGYVPDQLCYAGDEFVVGRGEGLDLGALRLREGATLTVRLLRAPGLESTKAFAALFAGDRRSFTNLDLSHPTRSCSPIEASAITSWSSSAASNPRGPCASSISSAT